VRGIVEAVSRLVEDRELRKRLGRAARRDVETTYSLERWNQALKEALDKALDRASETEPPPFTNDLNTVGQAAGLPATDGRPAACPTASATLERSGDARG